MISYIVVNTVTNAVTVWGRGEALSTILLPKMEAYFQEKLGNASVIYTANTFASGLEESVGTTIADGHLSVSNAVFTQLSTGN